MSYFKRYWTFYTSKLFQLFPKNLIVILGGQNWLIPYIVLCLLSQEKIFHCLQCLPLEKDVAPHMYKQEFPSQKDALCQVCWNWPSSLGTEDFCMSKLTFLHLRCFLPNLFEIDQVDLEKKNYKKKQTYNRWIRKDTWSPIKYILLISICNYHGLTSVVKSYLETFISALQHFILGNMVKLSSFF